jgi:hypothetical protein
VANFKHFLTLTMFLLLLFGCSYDTNDNNTLANEKKLQSNTESKPIELEFNIIASEKTLPTNFHEIAFERETTPLFQYLVIRAVNQSDFEKTWNLFGFENNKPNAELDENDVFFLGVRESGSCPYTLRNIELSSDSRILTVPLSGSGGTCTTDATPRTFVIEIDKEISNNLERVEIIESGVSTSIPF